MLDKNKTDNKLGADIREMLMEIGVETPFSTCESAENREKVIREAMTDIMVNGLGLDITDDSLAETPRRVAKMFVREVFWGLDYNNFPKITTIENRMQYDSMLLERNIKVHSFCEHHFVPMVGKAFVAYIPAEKVVGLSKINRVVEFFSRRPQVQERLTEQVFHTLQHILETENVAVLIKAEHFCVKLRGIEDIGSDTVTSRLGGVFMHNSTVRNEFYNLIGKG